MLPARGGAAASMQVRGTRGRIRRGLLPWMLIVVSAMAWASPAAAAPPEVNGLFWGDGDHDRYQLYNTSNAGSELYYYVDSDWTLYVALVVSATVNDTTFAPGPPAHPYTRAAGFNGPRHARALYDSEFAGFSLECGPNSWAWQQGFGGQAGGVTDYRIPDFIADATVGGGLGTPPPGTTFASSFSWNMNNHATRLLNGETIEWDMGTNFTDNRQWRSPFDSANPDTPVGLDGYPSAAGPLGYSATHQWEWPMVYEWGVDLSPICDDESLFVISGLSHHSPSKDGNEDDTFPPAPNGGHLLDFGDLPAIYGDPSHEIIIAGAHLGTAPADAETGTQYSDDALGDDNAGADDEDGIVFLTPLIPGGTATIQVTVTGGGYVSGFMDFNGDGALTPITYTSVDGAPSTGTIADLFLADGVYEITIDVPAEVNGFAYSRWRLTANAGEGGNSPTGAVTSGEVEDHAVFSTIGDFVWHDQNADGIQDVGEPGLPGVTVNLWQDTTGDGTYDTFVGSMVTDGNGLYLFEGLPTGSYQVTVDPTTVPTDFVPTTDNPLTLTLFANDENLDMDFGFVNASVVGTWTWLAPFGAGIGALVLLARRRPTSATIQGAAA